MPKASPTPVAPDLPASYEAALQELEQLLGSYRRGADLLTFCRDKLEAVEDQIKVLDQGMLKSWTPE
jgi:exodeoxyribonuclease VII small subunit